VVLLLREWEGGDGKGEKGRRREGERGRRRGKREEGGGEGEEKEEESCVMRLGGWTPLRLSTIFSLGLSIFA